MVTFFQARGNVQSGQATLSILVFVAHYPPAYRAGGPTRSVPGIVEKLGDEFGFQVVTSDHDLGIRTRLPGIAANRWMRMGHAMCMYLSRRRQWPGGIWWSIRGTAHDVLYVNSLFSIGYTLMPLLTRRFGLLPRRGLIVAPRGEMDPEALAIKPRRKRFYLRIIRALGLLRGAVWHATGPHELERIRAGFGDAIPIVVAPAIPASSVSSPTLPEKAPGSLEIVFIGRVARIKNLHVAIEALRYVRGAVQFEIFGPMEDATYWLECTSVADRLPPNVTVVYRGAVRPDEVGPVLAKHHLFFSPTRGENFGHAIVEAMLAGRPVLISDRTPWHGLEEKLAGWDVALSDVAGYTEVIQRCIDMDHSALQRWSVGARRMGDELSSDPKVLESYVRLFRLAS